MKRSERIKAIRSVAEHEEQEHSKRFGAAQQDLAAAMQKLAELDEYRRDYRETTVVRPGAPAAAWQEHNRFLQRLDQAVAAQQAIVRDGEVRREKHRQQWMVKRQRLESLSRAVERFSDAERSAAERSEQRAQDDVARRTGGFPKPTE